MKPIKNNSKPTVEILFNRASLYLTSSCHYYLQKSKDLYLVEMELKSATFVALRQLLSALQATDDVKYHT